MNWFATTATKHWKAGLMLICIFAYLIWLGLAHIWFSRTFEGRIVDHAGKPIKGAVVMVAWRFRSSLSAVPLVLKEARTDRHGRYVIEGWKPMVTPFGFTRLGLGEPLFHVIHPSHPPLRLMSTALWRRKRGLFNVAPGDFALVRLPPPFATLDALQKHAGDFQFNVYSNLSVGHLQCRWNMIPMFVNEMRALEARLALTPADFSLVVSLC